MVNLTSEAASATFNQSYPSGGAWTTGGADALFAPSDGKSATATLAASGSTQTLRVEGFGFTTTDIPPGSTINGISVTLNGNASGVSVVDLIVQLRKVDTNSATDRVGANRADTTTSWPTSSGSRVYGGLSDLWGTTWTDSEVRGANFGLDVVLKNNSASSRTATIDYCTILVAYTAGPISGVASATLSALTASSTAKLPVAGSLGLTLGALGGAGTGNLTIGGGAAAALAPLTLAATGVGPISGTLTATLGDLTVFAIDQVISYGESGTTLAALTLAATGTLPDTGSLNATFAPLGGSASGNLTLRGGGTPTLGALTLSAAGHAETLGALTVTLGALTVSAAGYQVLHTGTLNATLAAATLHAFVVEVVDDHQSQMTPFSPNWRDSYFVRYEFKTDVWASRSGKEQRRAQRTYPRKQMRYTVTVQRDDMLSATRLMEKYQGQSYTLPDWSRTATSAAPLEIGSNALLLTDDAPFWIEVTRGIVLVDVATGRQSMRIVEDVDGSLVSLQHGSGDDWPAGITILPAETGRFDTSIDSKQHTDLVGEVGVTFNVEPGYGPFDYAPRATENFGGREIFPLSPNRASALGGSFEHPLDQVDFGRGRVTTYLPIAFGSRLRQLPVTLPTLVDRMELIAFFHRMKGQRGEFYIPTFDSDLTVVGTAAAGDLTMRVAGSEVAALMDDTTTHRVIRLLWTGGYAFYRRIVDMTVDGDETILTTDAGWPFDVSQATLAAPLCWMTAARFASDTLEVECITTEIGRATLPTVTLEDLPVAQIDNAWSLTDEEQAGVDLYGYSFTSPEMADPLDQVVNILYPEAAGG